MALITQNLNDSKQQPLINEIISNKKNISYGSAKAPLSTALTQDSVTLNKKTANSIKKDNTKQQIAFSGALFKGFDFKKFIFGEKPILAKDLLADITGYIAPTKDNSFVHWLAYDVKNEKFGIADELIRPTRPFHENLWNSLTDLPNLITRYSKKIFGDEKIKEKINKEIKQSETRNILLGFWTNVTKIAGDFDKKITELNHDDLKDILKKGLKGNEEELSNFFNKRKLGMVFSFKDGKSSGILDKSDDKGNLLEGFIKEILGETPKSKEESFIEKVKKEYVQQTIDNITESKQGFILANFGQSEAMFAARAVSGIIPAWFIAHDFYNLKILNTNDKKQADVEWNSKFKQESGRIGIETYQGYILNSVFEKLTNKSLPFAVGLNIANTIGSNVFSRLATKRPILPINIEKSEKLNLASAQKAEELEKNIENNDKLNQLKSYKDFKKKNSSIGFGANNSGIINSIKSGLKRLDERFADAKICQAKLSIEEFKNGYTNVKQFDEKDARKMLEIAANRMKLEKDHSNLSLQDILDNAKGKEEIIIGKNWIYRYSKELVNIMKFPFEFSAKIGRWIANPIKKLIGMEIKEPNKTSSFYSEQFVKNVTKWADKVNKKMDNIDDTNIEEAIGRYAKNKKNFFSTAVMEYPANDLSTAMKLTGFTTVPFLATDAYNSTIGETKNKETANTKTKQRAIQDSSRQGISLWICYAFNQMGKAFSNASLYGSALVTAVQVLTYESLTRKLVGQPLSPTTHEKMVEIEKEKAKSKNWFVKLMAGRLKTNKAVNSDSEETTTKPANITQSATASNLNFGSPNVSDLYKKFSSNRN